MIKLVEKSGTVRVRIYKELAERICQRAQSKFSRLLKSKY